VLALACATGQGAVGPEPIRVGVSGPFTGDSSPMGLAMREGVRTAAAKINAQGGVLGRRIELIEHDDEGRSEVGASVAQTLIRRDKVVATIGMVNTGVALASQRYYQQARIPVMTAVATGTLLTRQFMPPEYGENYVFRVSCPDALQAAMIVDEAVGRRRFRKLAIFHDTTNYGQFGRQDLELALERRGLKPVAIERFSPGEMDLRPQIEHARAAGAEAILSYGVGADLARIANSAARIRWRVPLIGSWALAMSSFIEAAGPNSEGARMPLTWLPQSDRPASLAFREALADRLGRLPLGSPQAAAQGHDSLLLLVAAMRQAGGTDGRHVRAALEDLGQPVDGALMRYRQPFSPGDHEAIKSNRMVYIGEIRKGVVDYAYEADRHRSQEQ
jgi:branched-chain amino acid transport system substrate-binding protein